MTTDSGLIMYAGWHQVAFMRGLEEEVTPSSIGARRLVLVRRDDEVQAFDGVCPHRGAHLGYGGRLDGDVIVCPFHGHRIGLSVGQGQFRVCDYRALEVGGLVFVLLDERHENGLDAFLRTLESTHWFVPGFTIHVPIAPEWVIENVFDAAHFHTVHDIDRRPDMTVEHSPAGHLMVESVFETARANHWQAEAEDGGGVRTRFLAHVFSPTLVATELGPRQRAHVVITAATPDTQGECDVHVSLAVPAPPDGAPPARDETLALLRDSRTAFEQDSAIWAHIDTGAPSRYCVGDEPVVEYRRFCTRFES